MCTLDAHGHEGFVLSSRYDFENLKDTTSYTFPNIKFYQWNMDIHNSFMKKDFDIFHGALPFQRTIWLFNISGDGLW